MRLIKRLAKKLFNGKEGHSDHGSSPIVKTWFQLDVTPLDSVYQLIS